MLQLKKQFSMIIERPVTRIPEGQPVHDLMRGSSKYRVLDFVLHSFSSILAQHDAADRSVIIYRCHIITASPHLLQGRINLRKPCTFLKRITQ